MWLLEAPHIRTAQKSKLETEVSKGPETLAPEQWQMNSYML